jgi:hypothetical protein
LSGLLEQMEKDCVGRVRRQSVSWLATGRHSGISASSVSKAQILGQQAFRSWSLGNARIIATSA